MPRWELDPDETQHLSSKSQHSKNHNKPMTLKIISADDIMFQGDASVVHLPGTMGAFTVLPGHASLISTLTPGTVRYTSADGEHSVKIEGGIVDVDSDIVSVCIY